MHWCLWHICVSDIYIFSTLGVCFQVRFINFERTKLPEEILTHNLEEKRKYFSDICLDVEKSDAEVQVIRIWHAYGLISKLEGISSSQGDRCPSFNILRVT